MKSFTALVEQFHNCIWGKYSYSIVLTPRAFDGLMLTFQVNKKSFDVTFEEKYAINSFNSEELAIAFLYCFNNYILYVENLCLDDSQTVRRNKELKEFLIELKKIRDNA